MRPGISVEISIPNAARFAAAFAAAPTMLQLEERVALERSTFIAEAHIKALTPRVTGRLMASWSSRVDFVAARGIVATSVKYAPYVEFGTSPHEIVATTKKALFWRGAAHPIRKVSHPGTRGQHVARRGLENAKPFITAQFKNAVERVFAMIARSA